MVDLTRAVDLAWRLLELDPSNVQVGLHLMDLTTACDGAPEASCLQRRLQTHFQRTLGETPPEFAGGT